MNNNESEVRTDQSFILPKTPKELLSQIADNYSKGRYFDPQVLIDDFECLSILDPNNPNIKTIITKLYPLTTAIGNSYRKKLFPAAVERLGMTYMKGKTEGIIKSIQTLRWLGYDSDPRLNDYINKIITDLDRSGHPLPTHPQDITIESFSQLVSENSSSPKRRDYIRDNIDPHDVRADDNAKMGGYISAEARESQKIEVNLSPFELLQIDPLLLPSNINNKDQILAAKREIPLKEVARFLNANPFNILRLELDGIKDLTDSPIPNMLIIKAETKLADLYRDKPFEVEDYFAKHPDLYLYPKNIPSELKHFISKGRLTLNEEQIENMFLNNPFVYIDKFATEGDSPQIQRSTYNHWVKLQKNFSLEQRQQWVREHPKQYISVYQHEIEWIEQTLQIPSGSLTSQLPTLEIKYTPPQEEDNTDNPQSTNLYSLLTSLRDITHINDILPTISRNPDQSISKMTSDITAPNEIWDQNYDTFRHGFLDIIKAQDINPEQPNIFNNIYKKLAEKISILPEKYYPGIRAVKDMLENPALINEYNTELVTSLLFDIAVPDPKLRDELKDTESMAKLFNDSGDDLLNQVLFLLSYYPSSPTPQDIQIIWNELLPTLGPYLSATKDLDDKGTKIGNNLKEVFSEIADLADYKFANNQFLPKEPGDPTIPPKFISEYINREKDNLEVLDFIINILGNNINPVNAVQAKEFLLHLYKTDQIKNLEGKTEQQLRDLFAEWLDKGGRIRERRIK